RHPGDGRGPGARGPRGPAAGAPARSAPVPDPRARGRWRGARGAGLPGPAGRGGGAMSAMTDRDSRRTDSPGAAHRVQGEQGSGRRPQGRGPEPAAGPAPRMRRTLEIVLVALGMAGSLVVMGGFALVVNTIDQATFAEVVMPALVGADADVERAHGSARVLAAWFGVSLIVLLLLGAAGIALARSRPRRRSTGWLFLAAGLVCLLG